MKTDARCGLCDFYSGLECRRYPPTGRTEIGYPIFLMVCSDDWCGEFRAADHMPTGAEVTD